MGVLDEAQALAIETDVDDEVARAVAFADHSPDPTPDQLFDNAYAQPVATAPHQLPGDPVMPREPAAAGVSGVAR
jgi:pyruvate dehydrogenase E1 component alpha subunit